MCVRPERCKISKVEHLTVHLPVISIFFHTFDHVNKSRYHLQSSICVYKHVVATQFSMLSRYLKHINKVMFALVNSQPLFVKQVISDNSE